MGRQENEFLDLHHMQSEFAAHPNHGYASAKDPLWSGDMYVRMRLGDGSWIKIRVTEKYLDYAVEKSDRVKAIKKVTPRNGVSMNKEQDAKIRDTFRTAIEVAEKRQEECIGIMQKNKMTMMKLQRIRQNLDSLLQKYDSEHNFQNKFTVIK